MKVIIVESGEYEQRYVAFVAASADDALQHLRATQGSIDWELIDEMVRPRENAPHGGFTPYRKWQISPRAGRRPRLGESIYDLSEEEVIHTVDE